MSRISDEIGVALVKEVCPICGKQIDGPIIISSRVGEKYAEEVNKLNGQVIGFRDKPCNECQKLINDGCFFIIGIDSKKTEDWHNPYRTGHIVGLKRDCDFVKNLSEEYTKHDACYMDYNDMIKLGLIKEK